MGHGVHTVHRDRGWLNEVDGRQVGPRHETQEVAEAAGREIAIACQLEHHVHYLVEDLPTSDRAVGPRLRAPG